MSGAILALDAAAAACSVALWREGEVLAYRSSPMARGHAEALMPLVLEAMAAAGLEFADLDKIAVGVGPGSFQGIRIALAAARGMALAANRPVVGIDGFNALAAAIPAPLLAGRSLLVVIESKRRELFGQYFDSHRQPLGGPLVLEPSALLKRRPAGPLLVAGDGAAHLPAGPEVTQAQAPGRPDARAIARLAAEGRIVLGAAPLYLRPPDVSLPSGGPPGAPASGVMIGAEIPIRPLGAFQLQALAELHAACFAEAWDAEALAALLAMPGAFALMANEEGPAGTDGKALGFVMMRAGPGEAEIISLGVRAEGRRRGLGRRLLAAGSAEAALRGTQRLFLEVAADNLPARALYRGAGFAQIGRRENYYPRPGGATAALVLARDITITRNPGSQIGKKS